jgi:hypothetical protein
MVAAEVHTDATFQTVGQQRLFVLPPGTMVGLNSDFYDITSDDQRFLMVRPYSAEDEGLATKIILVQNFFEELKRLVPN